MNHSGARIAVTSVQAEWAPVHTSPLSLYADYSDMDFAGTRLNVLVAGLKLKFGGGSKGGLAERDRAGPDGWAAATTALKF